MVADFHSCMVHALAMHALQRFVDRTANASEVGRYGMRCACDPFLVWLLPVTQDGITCKDQGHAGTHLV